MSDSTRGRIEEEDQEGRTGSLVIAPTINAVLAPAKAFDMLDRRPLASLWILFWVLLVMIGLSYTTLDVTRQFTRVGMVEGMVNRGQEVDPEQLSRMVQTMDRFAPLTAVIQNVFLVLMVLLIAVVLWAGSSMAGGSAKFSRATAVAAVASVVHPLLVTAYVSFNWWLDPPEIRRMADIGNAVPTIGLDLLFGSADMSLSMRAFLMRVDLFNLWWAVLIVIGCQRMLRVGRGAAIALATLLWVASAVIASLMTGLGAGAG